MHKLIDSIEKAKAGSVMGNFGASGRLRAFLLASLPESPAALASNLKFKIKLMHSRRVLLRNPTGASPWRSCFFGRLPKQ